MDVYVILKTVDADTTVFFDAYGTLTEAQSAIDEDIVEFDTEQADYEIRRVVLKRKSREVDGELPLSECPTKKELSDFSLLCSNVVGIKQRSTTCGPKPLVLSMRARLSATQAM